MNFVPANRRRISLLPLLLVCTLLLPGALFGCKSTEKDPDSESESEKEKDTGNYLYTEFGCFALNDHDRCSVIYSGEKEAIVLEKTENDYYEVLPGLDGRRFALTDIEGGGKLYYYDSGKLNLVAEEAGTAKLSVDGSTLLYTVEDEEDRSDDLYLYRNGKSEKIAEDIDDQIFFISPDGSAVGYRSDPDMENTCTGYVRTNGKTASLGENVWAIALSDGGKYVYTLESTTDAYSDYIFCVRKGVGGKSVTLSDGHGSYFLNADGSQIVFFDESGSAMISVNGGEKKRLFACGSECWPLLPDSTARTADGELLGVKSFAGCCFCTYDKLYRIGSDFTAEQVVPEFDIAYMSADGKLIAYQEDESLFLLNVGKDTVETKSIVEEGVGDLIGFTADGKKLFYYDDGETIYCVGTDGKEPTVVAEEAYGEYCLYNGKTLYYIADGGDVYLSTGEKGSILTGQWLAADNFWTEGNLLLILDRYYGEESKLFYSDNGKDFDSITVID